MTLTPVEKIEFVKGKIRNLFSVDNEEFGLILNMTRLREYIKEHLDLSILNESMIAEVDKEIADRGKRIEQHQKRNADLEAFKLELAEMNSK